MATRTHPFGLSFGALSPPLRKQLADYKLDRHLVEGWQQDADAIVRLAVRGLLSEGEHGKANGRLFKRIVKVLNGQKVR